ncbi:MAG TPA: hypothetical protein VG013_29630 [Gemmataceae bacterium]|nr:hypothetical protein [Gemmataceae bacterium]
MERYREQKQKGRQLVEAMLREALEREREQKEPEHALIEDMHREAQEGGRVQPVPPEEPPTIPYTELPAAQPDSQLYREWNFYRHQVQRLLAEGQESRFVLIKGEDIIGIWDTEEEAETVAHQKCLMQPCLIHQVRSREPLLRGPTACARPP